MTIIEAINKLDDLKPNAYSQSDKIEWLSQCDADIKKSIIDTHEDGDDITFTGYDDTTALDTELIAYAPYDEMYIDWMESKIDYHNAEYTRYNNSVTRYNDVYAAFYKEYNRLHMPKGTTAKYY